MVKSLAEIQIRIHHTWPSVSFRPGLPWISVPMSRKHRIFRFQLAFYSRHPSQDGPPKQENGENFSAQAWMVAAKTGDGSFIGDFLPLLRLSFPALPLFSKVPRAEDFWQIRLSTGHSLPGTLFRRLK